MSSKEMKAHHVRTVCLHQVVRPGYQERFPGRGDCAICTHDSTNNPRCGGYTPVGLVFVLNDEAAQGLIEYFEDS